MVVCPDNRPALWQILVFGESIMIVGSLASTASYPLVYEFVPVDKLGTANAGLGMFRGLLGILIGPAMGLWIAWYSTLFYPAAGSNVSTVLQQDITQEQADSMLERWSAETGETYNARLVTPFGLEAKKGRQWDFRLIDASAEQIKKDVAKLEDQIKKLKAEVDDAVFKKQENLRVEKQAEVDGLVSKVKALEAQLKEKALDFRSFIATELGDQLTDSSQAVIGAEQDGDQLSIELAIMYPLDQKTIKRIARELTLQLEDSMTDINAFYVEPEGVPALKVVGTLMQGAATKADIDPIVMDSVHSYFSGRNDLNISKEQMEHFAKMAQSSVAVLAGYRDYAALPFPGQGYKPQVYDYFSSYLLMIATDFVAIYIVWLIARLEKKGKIKRLGALENQPV